MTQFKIVKEWKKRWKVLNFWFLFNPLFLSFLLKKISPQNIINLILLAKSDSIRLSIYEIEIPTPRYCEYIIFVSRCIGHSIIYIFEINKKFITKETRGAITRSSNYLQKKALKIFAFRWQIKKKKKNFHSSCFLFRRYNFGAIKFSFSSLASNVPDILRAPI